MTYPYKCDRCSWSGDISCSVADRDKQVCPICGSKLKRLIARPYFRIPRSFRDAPDDAEIFTPLWEPVKYNVSKRDLMRDYTNAIEKAKEAPDWLKRQLEMEEAGLFDSLVENIMEAKESGKTEENEYPDNAPHHD